jgi:PAS domain S-box-containing protein
LEAVMTRYRDLVENANDIIYTLDLEGSITSINQAGEQILGYHRDEMLNVDVERFVAPAYRDLMNQMQDRKLGGGGRTRYELEIVTKDGRILTLEVNSQLILHDNLPAGIQGIARDITERKLAEKRAEELQAITTSLYEAEQQARLEAEEADRLKLQFLAMISHELRTPLTSIKGFTSTLLSDDVTWDTESQHEFFRIMDVEADRLAALIDELLDLSKLHAGKLDIVPEPKQLGDILDAAQVELTTLAQHHHLVTHIPADLPPVLADTDRIVQVLTNLVSNAVKYSEPSTTITIDVRQAGEFVQVDVIDEGIGVSPDTREIMFEAFQQGNSVKKGAGLGLAICKGLIEAHGGRIWVGDRHPPGTTVSFTLPRFRA